MSKLPDQTPAEEPAPGARGFVTVVARVKHWVRPILVVMALGFMTYTARQLWAEWDGGGVTRRDGFLFASLLPLCLAALTQARAWLALLRHMTGRRVAFGPALTLYLDSQLARYTPGKVGLPAVRMAGAARLGVAARSVAGSIFFELLSWLASGALTGFCLLALADYPSESVRGIVQWVSLLAIVGATLGLLVLVLLDRRRLPHRLRVLLDVTGTGPLVPWSVPVTHLCYWLLWAAHGYLVVRGLAGTDASATGGMAFFVLAPILGFVALAAPAGVGVREAVIAMGLTAPMGAPSALAAGIASRVASLAADVCTWAICRLLERVRASS